MLSLLWQFKEYVVIGVMAIAIGGFMLYHNHVVNELDAAEKKIVVLEDALLAQSKKFEAASKEWQAHVDAVNKEIAKNHKEKKALIEKHRKAYDELFKRYSEYEQQSKTRIATQVQPTDVVVAPLALVREYNDAVSRAPATVRNGGDEVRISPHSFGAIGEVATFEGLAVAEVLIGNLHEYNRLALKCDKLIDIVIDLEKRYGTNAGAVEGVAQQPGGDLPRGAVEAQIF